MRSPTHALPLTVSPTSTNAGTKRNPTPATTPKPPSGVRSCRQWMMMMSLKRMVMANREIDRALRHNRPVKGNRGNQPRFDFVIFDENRSDLWDSVAPARRLQPCCWCFFTGRDAIVTPNGTRRDLARLSAKTRESMLPVHAHPFGASSTRAFRTSARWPSGCPERR
jgi:hypothetical protein